eukprot:scaffold29325_cov127-Isochrysis_galbana.AAC.3
MQGYAGQRQTATIQSTRDRTVDGEHNGISEEVAPDRGASGVCALRYPLEPWHGLHRHRVLVRVQNRRLAGVSQSNLEFSEAVVSMGAVCLAARESIPAFSPTDQGNGEARIEHEPQRFHERENPQALRQSSPGRFARRRGRMSGRLEVQGC